MCSPRSLCKRIERNPTLFSTGGGFFFGNSQRTFPQRKSPAERQPNHRLVQKEGSNNNKLPSKRVKIEPMPVIGYDAAAIEDHYDRRPLQVIWRLNSLGFPLLFWYISLLMDNALGRDGDEVQRRQGSQLREALVQSRSVALIKSGQALR